jgi:hypothetical protein
MMIKIVDYGFWQWFCLYLDCCACTNAIAGVFLLPTNQSTRVKSYQWQANNE